jgi:predicted anti-sigma-YlaC factor YlaD
MRTCEDIRALLEEHHDRELAGPAAAEVQAHLAVCPECSRELEGIKRLDDLLRAAPASPFAEATGDKREHPEWEGYVAAVRERARRSDRARWTALVPLAAAALLVAGLFQVMRVTELDVPALVDRHASASPEDRRAIELTLQHAGGAAVATLKELVHDPSPRRQASASVILAWHQDAAVRQWLVESAQASKEPAGEWELSEIGVEPSDNELVGCAFELLRSAKTREEAVGVLRKLDMGGINRAAHVVIVERARGLILSPAGGDQELGVELVRALDLKVLLPELVDLLDAPVLGDRVYDFLKAHERMDRGRDKEAWRRHFSRKL